MNLTIKSTSQEVTAYDKYISFTYDGQDYSVLLHWDMFDGYDLNFMNGKSFISYPDWAMEWEENHEETLEYVLDGLVEAVSA